ncbi:site-specific integrase [Bacillus paralicheniformis]|uniref:site-specific integrase n=1 Tax=Bacillus paralicheniformis TaxID=1648923 RepID=UPI00189DB19E|nr:site-specific integrase [Bacillus paralicheniformis]
MKFVQPIRDQKKIKEMKDRLSPRDSFLFTLGVNSGLRVSDALSLKVKDVKDKTHIILKESKTGKTKRFPVNKTLRTAVKEYTKGMNNEDWLFPSRKGDGHISRVQAYRKLNETARQIGLEEIGTHSMRKTFGYWFYKKTKDVAMLQKIFNHSSPSITLKYIGIEQEQIDEQLMDFGL